ncbi:MAG: type II secretion system protein [Candidatus Eremiobacterota bacterium]
MRRGFTLIELMIVVAIFAIISAILIPNFLKAREQARNRARDRQPRPAATATAPEPALPEGLPPQIDSADIRVALSVSHLRVGSDVYTRYTAGYQGIFHLRASDTDQPTRLEFDFPPGTLEARDVALRFVTTSAAEPPGVIYYQRGIVWAGTLPPDLSAVEVTYQAVGRDRLEYRLPRATRIRAVHLEVNLEGTPAYMLPDQALQPTAIEPGRLIWDFKDVVSDRPIVVELPGAQSPVGRVILLLKLVGIAVLLFGAGFWYLSDLDKPGRLESFRWGHFFLLALTYSLFFAVFAVLGFHGDVQTGPGLAIAAACSLPLLMLHVSRVLDARFALLYTLPLALVTLGLVVNGVYGGPARDYVFVGGTAAVVALLTLTYPRWYANRQRWLEIRFERLGRELEALTELARQAGQDQPVGADLAVSLQQAHAAAGRYRALGGVPAERREADCALLAEEIRRLTSKIQERRAATPEPKPTSEAYCVACGSPSTSAPFCAQCGVRQPARLTCESGHELWVPLHLLAEPSAPPADLKCPRCGLPVG